uniref:Acyl-CoA thioesterase 7 n=1 Tax=Rousettus aegyptiacus TaxID=9407 RepID=A0A7J8K484_ROUAE|nr:acyl-CoA thioesterase 7 [Rousettus aegyptiacus]
MGGPPPPPRPCWGLTVPPTGAVAAPLSRTPRLRADGSHGGGVLPSWFSSVRESAPSQVGVRPALQIPGIEVPLLSRVTKLTNKATLWYVPLSLEDVDRVLEVPPVVYSRQEQEQEGRKRYEAQKLERMETKWRNGDIVQPVLNPEPNTVSYSQSSLIHLVGPSDCTLHGFVHGGVTMKLMDDVAGIVATRHCKTNVVTASVDAINFHDKIKKGFIITISGRMTFTSNKSMEIEVLVDANPVLTNTPKRYRAASAFFTYVSLSQEGRSLPVPQLVPETEDEKKRFEEGKGRYLQMKAKRQGKAEPQP